MSAQDAEVAEIGQLSSAFAVDRVRTSPYGALMDLEALLSERFGHPGFRDGQLQIVEHVAGGQDALVVMPTGAGKSLCFQLPALARGGTTIVVSPLIALMKDQVDSLVRQGIKATFLNSSLTKAEYSTRRDQVRRGDIELLYVAPERFSPKFLDFLKDVDVRLFAIDEAHCLSQWGHDFRPDYLRLGKVREALGSIPTVALTATATPEVQKDIVDTLDLHDGRVFIRGFDRENLLLEVIEVGSKREKGALLADLVTPSPSIVYCATRKNVIKATAALREAGVRCGMYHAGLEPSERTRIQDDFMSGRVPVVAATNAFGMGIDKRDIRNIVHFDMPGTVEAYYQEIGRAGRDGRMSRAVMLHMPSDRRIHEFFINNAHPPADWVHRIYDWLRDRGTNPIYARVEDMAAALPDDAGDRAASSCVYILQREGMVRRIAASDRAATIRVGTAPAAPAKGVRGTVWQMITTRGAVKDELISFHPEAWAAEAGISRDQLHAALRGLEERGFLFYRAADRVGGVELLKPDERLRLDEKRMRARRARAYKKLDKMDAYTVCRCRRGYVIEYFGEKTPWERCGTCDMCREDAPAVEGPRPLSPDEMTVVVKLLANVARMEQASGKQGFSAKLIAKTAVGSREERVLRWKFDQISTHGILGSKHGVAWNAGEIADLLHMLVQAKCIDERYVTRKLQGREQTYKELQLAPRGWRVMKREEDDFELAFPHASKLKRKRATPGQATQNGHLMAVLREIRKQIADQNNVPAYVVASNRCLDDMAKLRPTTRRALLAVHGMGPQRVKKYGQPFIDAMRAYNE